MATIDLAAQLRTRRERASISLRTVARAAGVSHTCLSRVERGAAPVSRRQLARLEAALLLAAAQTVKSCPAIVDVTAELVR